MGALPVNYHPKAPAPNIITLGVQFQYMTFGGHKHSVHGVEFSYKTTWPWRFIWGSFKSYRVIQIFYFVFKKCDSLCFYRKWPISWKLNLCVHFLNSIPLLFYVCVVSRNICYFIPGIRCLYLLPPPPPTHTHTFCVGLARSLLILSIFSKN